MYLNSFCVTAASCLVLNGAFFVLRLLDCGEGLCNYTCKSPQMIVWLHLACEEAALIGNELKLNRSSNILMPFESIILT